MSLSAKLSTLLRVSITQAGTGSVAAPRGTVVVMLVGLAAGGTGRVDGRPGGAGGNTVGPGTVIVRSGRRRGVPSAGGFDGSAPGSGRASSIGSAFGRTGFSIVA